MSKQIPRDKPLSDEDREYLLMRGQDTVVTYLDQQFPPETLAADEDEDLEDLEDDLDEDEEEEGDEDEDDEDGEEEDEYDNWTVAQLQEELGNRKDENEVPLATTGKKAELVARLREHDAQ